MVAIAKPPVTQIQPNDRRSKNSLPTHRHRRIRGLTATCTCTIDPPSRRPRPRVPLTLPLAPSPSPVTSHRLQSQRSSCRSEAHVPVEDGRGEIPLSLTLPNFLTKFADRKQKHKISPKVTAPRSESRVHASNGREPPLLLTRACCTAHFLAVWAF